jgi:prefoldin subunit 5
MSYIKKLLAIVFVLLLVATPVYAVANFQDIEDWAKLRSYTPPSQISQITSQDNMTAAGRHLFYINHPELVSDKKGFRQECPQSEQSIVLGCYHSTESGIAIFDVSDPRLNGVEQVTAAHEMLHAAYDRLSSRDKTSVNNELLDYYNSGLVDQRIKDTINGYKKTEPNDVINEMHSIFGTEISALPAPLENYYKKYFTNRSAVTGFSGQYESVFTQNQAQLNGLKNQIDQLKVQLTALKSTIQNQETALAAENSRMQNLSNEGQTDEYNSSVDSYNAKVFNLRSLIAKYNTSVQKVNNLVDQYNALAYTQESLYSSLDTRLQTQTTQ